MPYDHDMGVVMKVGFAEAPVDGSVALIGIVIAAFAVAFFFTALAVLRRFLGD